MGEGKQKLTLSVDARVVERAKQAGVNISELTEQVLQGYSFDKSDLGWDAYKVRFLQFLKTMDPLLTMYGTSVVVGDLIAKPDTKDRAWEAKIHYSPYGFSADFDDESYPLERYERDGEYYLGLRSPGEVLQGLLQAMEQAKEHRKVDVANLLLASKIVEAITQAESGETPSRRTSGSDSSTAGGSRDGRREKRGWESRSQDQKREGVEGEPSGRKGPRIKSTNRTRVRASRL